MTQLTSVIPNSNHLKSRLFMLIYSNRLLNEHLSLTSRLTIWPYQPSIFVNLCTVDHDNSSCTYRNRTTGTKIPRPVMACRSSWYIRDIDLGTVIGYRAKDDVRSGLFVELLHGDKCYNQGK